MQWSHLVMPTALGLCLAASTIAATAAPPTTTYDGAYSGSMTLLQSTANQNYTGPYCVTERPVAMMIHHGNVFMSYKDWHRHTLHYRGQVDADGRVTAYHRNRDGSASALTGNVNGNQLTADIQRGRCHYTMTLTKG